MNLFDILEDRMQKLFEGNRMIAPLPFKKLARSAVREMRRCAVKIDGHRLAPTLYTVLVNPSDDAAMAPLYQDVTDELVDFLSHEAGNVGLEMACEPVVRFIAEVNVKPGKHDVIAEVVSADILEEVRSEESTYAAAHSGRAVAAADGSSGARTMQRFNGAKNSRQRVGARGANAVAPQDPSEAAAQLAAGLSAVPAMDGADDEALQMSMRNQQMQAAQAQQLRAAQMQAAQMRAQQQAAAQQAQAAQMQAPQAAMPQQAPQGASDSCQLTDKSSGRAWRVGVDNTVIGREENSADLILPDTNISRRHAQLSRTAQGWILSDLNSTNGTRVNGQRIASTVLQSGDLISLGLMQLEFQEL